VSAQFPDLERECFVISPIGSAGSPERERSDGVLNFIISNAARELDLIAVRGDQLAEPGQITRQILDHVVGAKAAVADLTDLNPNVFYELAVRHTARLPVALIAEQGCKLPFDIAQMRTIFFKSNNLQSADECRSQIVSHLRRAMEKDAVDSPIATSIDVRKLAEGSSADRSIADILTAVDYVAKMQRRMSDEISYVRNGIDSTLSSDSEILEIISDARAKAAELVASSERNAENARLLERMQDIVDMLGSIRINAKRRQQLPVHHISRRPTIRTLGEDIGPYPANMPDELRELPERRTKICFTTDAEHILATSAAT
jgi:hypothetical protein